jgi:ABC-type Fe3+-siderophore transport system permease subunit
MESREFDLEEFKGAWEHCRHLEQERTRHLVFFFSLVGGLVAAVGFLFKDALSQPIPQPVFLGASAIALVLQIVAMFVFAAVKRMGTARGNHERSMRHIRRKLESDDFIRTLWATFAKRRFRWFSVQGAAEVSVHLFAVVFAVANVVAAYMFTVKLQWYGTAIATVFPLLVLAFHASLAVKLELADPEDDLSSP